MVYQPVTNIAELRKLVARKSPLMPEEGEALLAEIDRLNSMLDVIARMPTVQRNPDGDDQAAATMQLVAREALGTATDNKEVTDG